MDKQLSFWLHLVGSRSANYFTEFLVHEYQSEHEPSLDGLMEKFTSLPGYKPRSDISPDLNWLNSSDEHHFISILDHKYPEILRDISNPPVGIFVKGQMDMLNRNSVAIVGSRNPTPQGSALAYEFGYQLAQSGVQVVSGLAYGIDSQAHRGTLSGNGSTCAVFACGLDTTYPKSNTRLAQEIHLRGCLISEFPITTPPLRHHFPLRNRLISGMSSATIVVEAGLRSGSLITARLAGEQGRDVFAIPGPVKSPQSKGCHKLLKEGAILAESPVDVLAELDPKLGKFEPNPVTRIISPNEPDGNKCKKLLKSMGYAQCHKDELIMRSGLTAPEVSSMLLELELSGHVVICSDGTYLRKTS